jgi:hypothetical protein
MRAGSPAAVAPRAPVKIATLADLKPSTPPPALGGTNGHHVGHAVPAPVAVPSAASSSSSHEAATEPRRWSTMWPLIVAVVAICAIVASVAMLLFGGDGGKKSSKARRFEGPAPELTPTDPGAHQVVPPDSDPLPRPSIPDPIPPPPSPGAGPVAPSAAGPRDVQEFIREAFDVGCKRMTACQGSDPVIASYCQMAPSMITQLGDSLSSSCHDFDGRAGRACIDSIGRLPCPGSDADPNAMAMTLLNLTDCQKVCGDMFGDLGLDPADPDGL